MVLRPNRSSEGPSDPFAALYAVLAALLAACPTAPSPYASWVWGAVVVVVIVLVITQPTLGNAQA
jgi:hypothetical protein